MATTIQIAEPAVVELKLSKMPSWLVLAARISGIVVPLFIWIAPLNLEEQPKRAIAIASFIIISWIAQCYEHAIAGIVGCFLFWSSGLVSFNEAFAGFSDSTTWFLFGAMLFGLMATKTGLAPRLANLVMGAVGTTYSRLLLGIIISDFLLTFVVPSGIARVTILAGISVGLVKAFGLAEGSNIGRGLFIILTYTATIFDKMIIAGAASMTARRLIEKFGHVEVLWSQWLLAYLPCTLLTIFAAWRVALWLYPPEQPSLPGGAALLNSDRENRGAWTPSEKKASLLMLSAITLWMTDSIHHIPAPMIGIGIGLAATLPGIGVLNADDVKKVNFLPMFFVATALSMTHVLYKTGAVDLVTGALMSWMTPLITDVYSSSLTLYWTAFVYHIFIGDEISMLSTSIPVLMNFATSHGLNALALGMIWTFAAGGKIFVYQSGVLIVGHAFGYFDGWDMLKMGFALTVVESLILLLLVPIYWPLIGLR
jgi:solute carrier family 13 (sodium-dependent dicarboxylate transporter), member 2/3/5